VGLASGCEICTAGSSACIADRAFASPMLEGVTRSVVASSAHHHNPALPITARNGRWAAVGSLRGAIALPQGWSGFGQGRTGDDEAHFRERTQDVAAAGAVVVVFVGGAGPGGHRVVCDRTWPSHALPGGEAEGRNLGGLVLHDEFPEQDTLRIPDTDLVRGSRRQPKERSGPGSPEAGSLRRCPPSGPPGS
jgi:hypothetical protein